MRHRGRAAVSILMLSVLTLALMIVPASAETDPVVQPGECETWEAEFTRDVTTMVTEYEYQKVVGTQYQYQHQTDHKTKGWRDQPGAGNVEWLDEYLGEYYPGHSEDTRWKFVQERSVYANDFFVEDPGDPWEPTGEERQAETTGQETQWSTTRLSADEGWEFTGERRITDIPDCVPSVEPVLDPAASVTTECVDGDITWTLLLDNEASVDNDGDATATFTVNGRSFEIAAGASQTIERTIEAGADPLQLDVALGERRLTRTIDPASCAEGDDGSGSVRITKVVQGDAPDGGDFSFDLQCRTQQSELPGDGNWTGDTAVDGTDFVLADDLEPGTACRARETADGGAETTAWSVTGASEGNGNGQGTDTASFIVGSGEVVVTFTNDFGESDGGSSSGNGPTTTSTPPPVVLPAASSDQTCIDEDLTFNYVLDNSASEVEVTYRVEVDGAVVSVPVSAGERRAFSDVIPAERAGRGIGYTITVGEDQLLAQSPDAEECASDVLGEIVEDEGGDDTDPVTEEPEVRDETVTPTPVAVERTAAQATLPKTGISTTGLGLVGLLSLLAGGALLRRTADLRS